MSNRSENMEKVLNHLKRVSLEIEKLLNEIYENPDEFGHLESRLFWAMRGVDPQSSICSKHNKKIVKNSWGEYVCLDCVDEMIRDVADNHVDDLWFEPDNEPCIKIDLKYTAD